MPSSPGSVPCSSFRFEGPFPPPTASAANRPVTASDLTAFIEAFAKLNVISTPSDFLVKPGSARVAYMPSTHTYWGLATFDLRPGVNDPYAADAARPLSNMLVFARPQGCPWVSHGPIATPFPCPADQDLPMGVQHAWNLKSPSLADCANSFRPPVVR